MDNKVTPYTIDLSYLLHKLQTTQSWPEEKCKTEIEKYRNFLSIHAKYPEARLVPTADIDEVWHAHILNTVNYTKDCQKIFGAYFHHQPSHHEQDPIAQEASQANLKVHFIETALLYELEFGESYLPNKSFIAEWHGFIF